MTEFVKKMTHDLAALIQNSEYIEPERDPQGALVWFDRSDSVNETNVYLRRAELILEGLKKLGYAVGVKNDRL